MSKRNHLVYLLLAIVWLALVALQVAEHRAFRKSSEESLQRHALDLSNALGVVIRTQRRFGTVSKDRLASALQGLAESEEVLGIMLFNPVGGAIASAGEPMDADLGHKPPGAVLWGPDTLTVVELAEFGPEPQTGDPSRQTESTLLIEGRAPRPGGGRRPPKEGKSGDKEDLQAKPPPEPSDGTSAVRPDGPGRGRHGDRRRGPGWSPETRERFRKWAEASREGKAPPYPPWMTGEEYQTMFKEQGLHKLAFRLSARDVLAAIRGDSRQRHYLVAIGLVAVGGLALLYRQMSRSSQLGLQLVRAEAMNNHLREMNLSAAGLAHETRNPLNVVRGLAQLLAKEPDDAVKARATSERIVGEVDRVSNRLNEFIAYSKPREPVLAPVDLRALVEELGETLASDCEELEAQWRNDLAAVEVAADEGMLRQVLFNILINALQAIPKQGVIRISSETGERGGELTIRIADSGPGVPEDISGDVFRPYVSARDKGTGLGLAVVRQIILAHHWQIHYGVSDDLGGAEFSVTNIRITNGG